MIIGLVDLEVGNLGSLLSALKNLNVNLKICKDVKDIDGCNKIILPGVGAFGDFARRIKDSSIDVKINEIYKKRYPILGICVGFQIFFEKSFEHGENKGLSILDGEFVPLNQKNKNLIIPHVGWNQCDIVNKKNKLFDGIENNSDFYFTHSYFLQKNNQKDVLSITEYDHDFVSSVNRDNLYGVQFHPEKSQKNGLRVLKNFIDIC